MSEECYYCNQEREDIRPYGPKGQWVCNVCANKPENVEATTKQFFNQIEEAAKQGHNGMVVFGEQCGPRPGTENDVHNEKLVKLFMFEADS